MEEHVNKELKRNVKLLSVLVGSLALNIVFGFVISGISKANDETVSMYKKDDLQQKVEINQLKQNEKVLQRQVEDLRRELESRPQ